MVAAFPRDPSGALRVGRLRVLFLAQPSFRRWGCRLGNERSRRPHSSVHARDKRTGLRPPPCPFRSRSEP
jgi:hypothetical protein